MRKLRVLCVSAVPDFKGGAETVIKNMLANPYIESVLATPSEGPLADSARASGVDVCYYRPTALLGVHRPPRIGQIVAAVADAFRCAARLRGFMRDYKCDFVHSHGLKPHALCVILSLFWRVSTVVHMHDIPYSRAERIVWRLIALCSTRVILVSRPCYPGKRLPHNVIVIPNGIVPNQVELEPKETVPTPLRLGFVGRFHPNKGMDLLLDWLNAIRAAGLEVTLALRGRPDPELPAYWDHIQARINGEGLASIIHHDGWLSRAELYDDLDVLMVPSHIPDPGPLVVAEAMSAGVIVIGYPAGGIPFSIQNGLSGLLIKNAADVGAALAALVRTPGAFSRMRQDAHVRALTTFGLDTFYRRIDAVYRSALSGAKRDDNNYIDEESPAMLAQKAD